MAAVDEATARHLPCNSEGRGSKVQGQGSLGAEFSLALRYGHSESSCRRSMRSVRCSNLELSRYHHNSGGRRGGYRVRSALSCT